MPFVKLDCGIINSTIWFDRPAREVFLTALLMAEPREFTEPVQQIEVNTLNETGWAAPPGWYGFVGASGPGIIDRSKVSQQDGRTALERLGSPETESRSQEYDGRRLIRVDGGYLVLNYMKYRDRDYTQAERARRYRIRKQELASRRDVTASRRDITQAEAEAEAEAEGRSDLAAPKIIDHPKIGVESHAVDAKEPRAALTITNGNPHAKPTNLINGPELRRHGSHAWCSWPQRDGFCIPHFLHSEFKGKGLKTDDEMQAWYQQTMDGYADTAIGDEPLTFWRNEFAAWIGTVTSAPDTTSKAARTMAGARRVMSDIRAGKRI